MAPMAHTACPDRSPRICVRSCSLRRRVTSLWPHSVATLPVQSGDQVLCVVMLVEAQCNLALNAFTALWYLFGLQRTCAK